MTLVQCRECRAEVSPNAPTCPRCGAPEPARPEFKSWGYEWRSETTVFGVPLVHVAIGRDRNRKLRVAKGIVAIGQFAVGLVTVAQVGVGIVGIGQFLLGFALVAQFALASVAALGQFATGALWCAGQFAIGRPYWAQVAAGDLSNLAWSQKQLAIGDEKLIFILLGATFLAWLTLVLVGRILWGPRARVAAAPAAPPAAAMAAFLAAPEAATAGAPDDETRPDARRSRLAAEPELPPGTRLGPYRVVETIGRGGMGVVYRAEHAHLARAVALKVLPRELARHEDFVERFKREAQALAALRHPHIVAVYDMGQEGDLCYFAMEYVDGTDLRTVLREKALAPEQALHLVPKLCDALEYAHGRGIIHRDIKPENVLLGRDGEPRIADFGLARIVRGDARPPTITATGATMGTPDYMAPEQRAGARDVDHRADIYSLGVVLYEMLTGGLPIGRFDPPAKKVRVDVRIDEVVLRALENDRDRRYPRAAAMGDDVRRISSGLAYS